MNELEALSPLDGRYKRITKSLAPIFSECGLMKYRVRVEAEYLITLSEHPQLGIRELSGYEQGLLRKLSELSAEDATMIKAIETRGYGQIKPTNHDLKAIEYFMKEKLRDTSLEDQREWIHFGLTSEDVNSVAYGLMLSDGLEIVLPVIGKVSSALEELALKYKDIPMLARTHGQPASPTTFGKEFKVFSSRLERQLDQLAHQEILVKLNGATGNYNAHHVAYLNIDWITFTKNFVERFNEGRRIKIKPNLITTQIEPGDAYAELFDNLRRVNTILLDFNQDLWRYISDDWITLKQKEGEVGSSTMPHKINPIDFENSEGNLGVANALLAYFSTKLPISRLQRDLSDSTVKRNFGVALGHCLVGYQSILKGLEKITINEQKVRAELERHPEVIAEAIQTILRREGLTRPYEQLRELTRGRTVTLDDFRSFIAQLPVSNQVKEELNRITPLNYTGLAHLLVEIK